MNQNLLILLQALSSCLILPGNSTVVCSSWDNNMYVILHIPKCTALVHDSFNWVQSFHELSSSEFEEAKDCACT